jgi:hypothetical protein
MLDNKPGRATGPRTPEGKARSSMNALKEGFRSQHLIILPGQEEEFKLITEHVARAFTPLGETEMFLYEEIIYDTWNLHRVRARQNRLAEENGIDPLDDPNLAKEYDRLLSYEARFKSSLRANLTRLENVQTSRIAQSLLPEPLDLGKLPRLAKVTVLLQFAKRTDPKFEKRAVNVLISRVNNQNDRPERKPPNTPIQFRDFLTDEEKAKY